MFYLQDKSLLEFQRKTQERIRKNNLTNVFKVSNIPSDTQIRTLIDNHSYEPLQDVFADYFHRLQRNKTIEKFKFLNSFLIPIDATQYFISENVNCKKCLVKESKKSETKQYYHQILQATLVHPDFRQVIPLAPEFISNSDGTKKQDCEIKAGKRMLKRIRRAHKMLPMIIVGDDLYSRQPFIEELLKNKFSFILVCKPASHKHLFEEIDSFRKGNYLATYEYKDKKGKRYLYEWVNQVTLNANNKTIKVNFAEFSIFNGEKRTYHNSWVTDIEITKDNVVDIVRGGRARWKIENEGFNTLKNHGYHLEHNFGHGDKNLSEAFFILNLLAFFFHQIFELTDQLYQQARAVFSARIEYWNCIRSAIRLIIFDEWDDVLLKIWAPDKFP